MDIVILVLFQAVEFIAEHLRNEDEYVQVGNLELSVKCNDSISFWDVNNCRLVMSDWSGIALVNKQAQLIFTEFKLQEKGCEIERIID